MSRLIICLEMRERFESLKKAKERNDASENSLSPRHEQSECRVTIAAKTAMSGGLF